MITRIVRRLVFLAGILAALPFVSYGVVGLIRVFDVDRFLARYVGLSIPSSWLSAVVCIAIGVLVGYALKVISERIG